MVSIRITGTILALGALILCAYDVLLAKGFALGGCASLVGLWILYRQTHGNLSLDPTELQVRFMKGAMLRIPVYGVAFYLAYRLDPVHHYALYAALAAYFTARAIVVYGAIRHAKF